MITDNYGRNSNTDTRKTEELFAIFLTNPVRYVSGWKLFKRRLNETHRPFAANNTNSGEAHQTRWDAIRLL
jgi:hypothetical protein